MRIDLTKDVVSVVFKNYNEYKSMSDGMPRIFRYNGETKIWSLDLTKARYDDFKSLIHWLDDVGELSNVILTFDNSTVVILEEFKIKVNSIMQRRFSSIYEKRGDKLVLLKQPEPFSFVDTISFRTGGEQTTYVVPDSYASRKLLEEEFHVKVDFDDLFVQRNANIEYELDDFLLPHQIEGVEWIIDKITEGYTGVILADEMGLGKTVQALETFFVLKDKIFKKLVIVANKSTVLNAWTNDMLKFFGTQPRVVKDLSFLDATDGIYITNYEKLASMLADKEDVTELSKDTMLILDEATKVKNQDTDNYKAVMRIRGKSFVLALTGTPVENNLGEYYSILTVVCPFFMPRYMFNRLFVIFKERKINNKVIKTIDGHRNVDMFYRFASPFVLRRTKSVLDQLPDKEIIAIPVTPTYEQERVIEIVKERAVRKYKDEVGQMAAIVIIRRILDDPMLIHKTDSELVNGITLNDYTSPKFVALESVLTKHNPPFVIFTEFEDMADILKERLSAKYKVAVISGQHSVKERNAIIADFKAGVYDILITTDALAYGVNLQFVDVLINYDIPWNPGRRAQRVNRIHRIGSTSKKYIYDIVSEGIEMAAYRIILEKLELFAKAVEGKEIHDSSVFKQIANNYFSVVGV